MHIEPIPAWTAALPFFGAVVILGLGQLAANFVSTRLSQYVEDEKLKVRASSELARNTLDEVYPSKLDGSELARRIELDMDFFQAGSVVLTPAVGLVVVFFTQRTPGLLLFLLLVPAMSAALTLWLATTNPGRYRLRAWAVFGILRENPISFVTWLGCAFNLAAGIAAWCLAPDTAAILRA